LGRVSLDAFTVIPRDIAKPAFPWQDSGTRGVASSGSLVLGRHRQHSKPIPDQTECLTTSEPAHVHFNREQPTLGTFSSPRCDKPTSRCQTAPSMLKLSRISLVSQLPFIR